MRPGAAETVENASTLGSHLDGLGRRLADRHVTDLPWLAPLGPVLDRFAELAQPAGERFERHDDGRVEPPMVPIVRRPVAGAERPATSLTPRTDPRPRPSSLPEPKAPREGGEPPQAQPLPGRQRRLPADVRASLRRIAGEGADAMTVHDGPASDTIARRHGADAVTLGKTVHVRSGRFDPGTPEGFGLLAHEATHVSESLHAPAHRRHAHGRAAEEDEALRREAQARVSVADPSYPVTTAPSPPRRPQATAAEAEPHAHAMTASSERSVPTGVHHQVDLDRLRRDLIGDVMRQLRSEFERGA